MNIIYKMPYTSRLQANGDCILIDALYLSNSAHAVQNLFSYGLANYFGFL